MKKDLLKNLKLLSWLVVGNFLIAGVLLQKLSTHLYLVGRIPEYCDGTVIHCLYDLRALFQGSDSWMPMLEALHVTRAPRGIYQTVFFNRNIKFQYPLTSLIPLWLMKRAGMDETGILFLLNVLSAAAIVATVLLGVFVAIRGAKSPALNGEKGPRLVLTGLTLLMGFTFYPLIRGYTLGQIQVFINFLFCVAYFCWLTGRERAAGAMIGIITLVKPQYALILLWGVLRRRMGFFYSGLICLIAGTISSILIFGLSNNLDYFPVLSFLSKHGEAFFPNQSFNGLLNRLIGNGSNVMFSLHGFPEYLPAVYLSTIVTSLLILAWAIPLRVAHSESNRVIDFSLVAIAVTIASPIAWEHHYGILLPILMWQVGRFIARGELSHRQITLFAVVYLLVANDLRMTALLAFSPFNVLQSYLFFGVLLLIGLLKGELEPAPPEGLSVIDRGQEIPTKGAMSRSLA